MIPGMPELTLPAWVRQLLMAATHLTCHIHVSVGKCVRQINVLISSTQYDSTAAAAAAANECNGQAHYESDLVLCTVFVRIDEPALINAHPFFHHRDLVIRLI